MTLTRSFAGEGNELTVCIDAADWHGTPVCSRPRLGCGAYLHTGPETLFEEFGFVRDRRIAKWRWVMRLRIAA